MSRSEIDDIFAAPLQKKLKTSPTSPTSQPETLFDPSKKHVPRKRPCRKKKLEENRFTDSRGSVPRRKTADGYNIYKEDELGLSSTGGDTPLCPFDCQCCF